MSRVGKAPIYLGDDAKVEIAGQKVTVKGPKTSQAVEMRPNVKAEVNDGVLTLKRVDDTKESRALHGLYRALLQNAVTGVTKGWSKSLELNGVGYRAAVSGKKLELTLGYSHPIIFDIPEGLDIKVEKQTTVTVTGANRELVGQASAKIRGFRPPEPFLGKGVKYSDEVIRRKAGKSAGK